MTFNVSKDRVAMFDSARLLSKALQVAVSVRDRYRQWTFQPMARTVAIILSVIGSGCSSVGFVVANAPTHFGSFRTKTGLKYGEDPRQRLDVYAPQEARNCPVVVFFYGGSWQWGDRSHYRFVGAALAARGIVTVIPDYRLYPQVRFPLFVEDGANAVAWAHQHVREFGGDPDKLVLMGHSAGGQIAAMLAVDDTYLQQAGVLRSKIAGLVGLSGTYVLVPDDDHLKIIFSSPYTTSQWQPVSYVSEHSPPTLLLHGSDDKEVYPVESEKMRDALLLHHVDTEMHLYRGRGHSDTVASFSLLARFRAPALQQTIDFVQRVTCADPPLRGIAVSSLRASETGRRCSLTSLEQSGLASRRIRTQYPHR